jgi:hypothetical protein
MNIQEGIVSRPIHSQILTEQATMLSHSMQHHRPPPEASYHHTHPEYTNQPSPAGDVSVHTLEEYIAPGSEVVKSLMSLCSCSSIHDNQFTIDIYTMQFTMLTKQIGRLNNEVEYSKKKLLNEQKMKSKYKCEVDRLNVKRLDNQPM